MAGGCAPNKKEMRQKSESHRISADVTPQQKQRWRSDGSRTEEEKEAKLHFHIGIAELCQHLADAEPTQPEITSSHPAAIGSYITASSSRLAAAFSSAPKALMQLLVPFCPRPPPLRPFLIVSTTPCKRGRKCFPALVSRSPHRHQPSPSMPWHRLQRGAHTCTHPCTCMRGLASFPQSFGPLVCLLVHPHRVDATAAELGSL